MKQFIPFNDEWFDHPEQAPGPLVPFQLDMPCRHELAVPADQRTGPTLPSISSRSPT
jgi:hypothetical protein